jgi:hypothetical protein
MRFIAGTATTRFVAVNVERWRGDPACQIAMLGHELWHVLELARSQDVRDLGAFHQLYKRIGNEWSGGRFETAGAVAMESAILAELTRAHGSGY